MSSWLVFNLKKPSCLCLTSSAITSVHHYNPPFILTVSLLPWNSREACARLCLLKCCMHDQLNNWRRKRALKSLRILPDKMSSVSQASVSSHTCNPITEGMAAGVGRLTWARWNPDSTIQISRGGGGLATRGPRAGTHSSRRPSEPRTSGSARPSASRKPSQGKCSSRRPRARRAPSPRRAPSGPACSACSRRRAGASRVVQGAAPAEAAVSDTGLASAEPSRGGGQETRDQSFPRPAQNTPRRGNPERKKRGRGGGA